MILLDGLLLGVVIRLIQRRPLAELKALEIRHPGLILCAFALQVAMPGIARILDLPQAWAVAGWVCVMIALAVLAFTEYPKLGMSLIGVGIAANALVIALNGSMPVSQTAISRVLPTAEPRQEWDLVHSPMAEDSEFRALGDWIPVPGPAWHRGVVSPGDVIMALGVAMVVGLGASRGARRRPPHVAGAP